VAEIVDPDIFTDQKGHEELDPVMTIGDRDHAHSMGTLPSLNERMSDEALDDCHAFSDLKEVIRQISRDHAHSSSGLGGSGTGVGAGLTAASSNASGISSRSSENSLSREGSLAGGSLIGDGGHLLETLEEFEEEEGSSEGGNDDDDDDDDDDENGVSATGKADLNSIDFDDDLTVQSELTQQTACTAQTAPTQNISVTRKKLTRLMDKRK